MLYWFLPFGLWHEPSVYRLWLCCTVLHPDLFVFRKHRIELFEKFFCTA